MKDTPILYTGHMVRSVLADRKNMTRRAVKGTPLEWLERAGFTPEFVASPENGLCPYGKPGDRLWVKETFYAWGHWTKRYSEKKRRDEWHFVDETIGSGNAYRYEADKTQPRRRRELNECGWWKRPAIFMPRAASRITLEVTGVRIERLQDISRADAKGEGCDHRDPCDHVRLSCAAIGCEGPDYRVGFRHLWESINGAGSWDANQWVWVIEFKRVKGVPA